MFGCVADIGWITGHSHVVYGPLASGGTAVMFESTPVYPDPGTSLSIPVHFQYMVVHVQYTVRQYTVHTRYFSKRYISIRVHHYLPPL